MRYVIVTGVLLVYSRAATDQPPTTGWKTVKDAKGVCHITVPENWTPTENSGWAVLEDSSKGIAVVTSQPGQTFNPLSESLLKILNIPKEKMFENTTRRIFYQDKIARNANDPNSFSVMVPGKGGTCSSRVAFLPVVPQEIARKIALSVGPVPE